MSCKRTLTNPLTVVLLVIGFFQVASAKDIYLKVITRANQEAIYKFDGYDNDGLTFELKLGKKDREINIRDISSFYFDTTAIPDTAVIEDSLDRLTFSDGKTISAIFKKMGEEEIKVSVLEDKWRDRKFPTSELKRIDVSLKILDVDRREFGKGFNLFGEDIELAIVY